MRELVVVRHGESEGNVADVAQGRRPYPLTERGRAQAARVAEVARALGWSPTHVVTSPVRRCVETAAIVTARLDAPAAVEDEAFTEIDCGRGTGRTYAALVAEHPELSWHPAAGWPGFAPLGGESQEDVFGRVARGLDRLPADAHVLLVTHGCVFKAVLAHLLGLRSPYHLDLRTGSCLRLERRRLGGGEVFAFTHYLHPEEWVG